jgi:peptide chain release factor subunit 1
MEEAEKYELEETINELEGYRGRHTELVSVYIPSGCNVNQVTTQIEDEKGTAANIKSKTTRKNVVEALEKISRNLKLLKQTPPNGLVLFSGNVSEAEGQNDIKLWAIEPPKELNTRLYRCDQTFILEPLKEMVATQEVFGLLVVDRKEATIGLLEGKSIKELESLTSGIPGKQRAGGQSAQRFHRITEGLAKEFFRRVAENMKSHFFDMEKLKGILIGGPIPTKEEFIETGNLVTKLKNMIISVQDLGDTGTAGLESLVELSKEALKEQEVTKEKALLTDFFTQLSKTPDKTAYGEKDVKKFLDQGAVATLIISKTLDKKIMKELEKIAKQYASEVKMVSKETTEGVQFENLGGVGAILRFAMPDVE